MRKRYENLDAVRSNKSMKDMLRWSKERRSKVKDLTKQIEQSPDKKINELQVNRSRTSFTWIGHSTFFIQMNGLNILTDPVWAKRMGYEKRSTEPGIAMDDMPEIDVVVISHGHYDHLDFPTLKRLKGNPHFFVPAGLKRPLIRRGYRNVTEMNWWDSIEHQGITIHFVPAQHWTRRTLTDINTSHWGGFIFQSWKETYYFVGDTGYFPGFQQIAERFNIDTVFMPIGAYEPEWFMAPAHISPEDSVKAFIELEAKYFVPMHYGTYRLADDTGPEALERLHLAWKKHGLPEEQLKVLLIGGTIFEGGA
ncbi:MBL fold metallo-hydrolase [Neobacillus mesonae]|uniref:MBL fold metallo-hydrolase n=1 Tax=Neobacillus mesonae TaxID=1193713 RepID=A0A3T0HXL6_9BACI|nr:MBL fold metallo-hydrolase [Neobacillus mesonae]AZU61880.1 MBL fold metallo-hydrolase [Neobacillus mesonae]